MNIFYIIAALATLLFPIPSARITTTSAAQIVALAPVERVFASTTPSAVPRRAAIAPKPTAEHLSARTLAKPTAQKSQPAAAAGAQTMTPPRPPTTPPSSTSSFTALELAVIADINAARAASGLSALAADSKLGTIARGHSTDMLDSGYFEHTSPSGCTAVCRYQNAGYGYWSMGENIYWMGGFSLATADAAQKVVDAWQNSPGHRENDLGKFTRVGVGIAQAGSKVYVTADFATPR